MGTAGSGQLQGKKSFRAIDGQVLEKGGLAEAVECVGRDA